MRLSLKKSVSKLRYMKKPEYNLNLQWKIVYSDADIYYYYYNIL